MNEITVIILFLFSSYSLVICRNYNQQKTEKNTENYTTTGYDCFDSNFILNLTIGIGDDFAQDSNVVNESVTKEDSTVQIIQFKQTDEVLIHEIRIMRDIFVDQCGFANWPG